MPEQRTVLVVEDDAFYSSIYKAKFEKEGLTAVIIGNGDAALAYAQQNKPALVLMDIIIPGKDGFEILSAFKGDSNLKDIPVVMLSNLSSEEDILRAKSIGAADYIVKANVSIEEVMKLVKQYVG